MILYRFHRIAENAAPLAADVFLANAQYVGVLDAANRLLYKAVSAGHSIPNEITTTDNPKEDSNTLTPISLSENGNALKQDDNVAQIPTTTTETKLLTETTNEEKLVIKLTEGRRAYLSYPRNLGEKDIAILRLQLEALALTI